MNLVSLTSLKKLRYAQDDSVRLPKLQRWARDGKIPGAFKPTPSSDWTVDLEEFDRAMKEAKCASQTENAQENRLYRRVIDLIRKEVQA